MVFPLLRQLPLESASLQQILNFAASLPPFESARTNRHRLNTECVTPRRVEQDHVMVAHKALGGFRPLPVAPNDLISETSAPEHGIHEELEGVAHGRVAMEVDAPRGFQDAAYLQQPRCHVCKIGFVAGCHGRQQNAVHSGMLRLDEVDPLYVHIAERPCVFERGPGSFGTDGRSVVVLRVERRVEIYQVYRGTIHAPHDIEVVARPYGLVGPIRIAHNDLPIRPSRLRKDALRNHDQEKGCDYGEQEILYSAGHILRQPPAWSSWRLASLALRAISRRRSGESLAARA